ncbi:protein of unknown function [Rhodovastum atsumiense]|nr:protein of unknown function [Rhodovastum atsumiense]
MVDCFHCGNAECGLSCSHDESTRAVAAPVLQEISYVKERVIVFNFCAGLVRAPGGT